MKFETIPYGRERPPDMPNTPPQIGNVRGYRFSETLRPGQESGRTLRGIGAGPVYRGKGHEKTQKGLKEIEKEIGVDWESAAGKLTGQQSAMERIEFFNRQTERVRAVNDLIATVYESEANQDAQEAKFLYDQAVESMSKVIRRLLAHDPKIDGFDFAEQVLLLMNGIRFKTSNDRKKFMSDVKKHASNVLRQHISEAANE